MTVKVTIVDRDQREEQNLITRRNVAMDNNSALALADMNEDERYDGLACNGDYSSERLLFHSKCGSNARVVNSGLTALRPNAVDDFNNAVVITNRPMKIDEVFEVRLDKMVSKWAGSIEIGVTTHGPTELEYPSTMTNVRSGTWIMTGAGVMHNGQSVIADYGTNLDRLGAGDRVGVIIRDGGRLHFMVNGVDQGEAGVGLPPKLYAVVDLYGQASQASIVAQCESCAETPTGINTLMGNSNIQNHQQISSGVNCCVPDIHFHSVHGRNARVSSGGRTASRPRAMAEFNDAIVITNRPLGRNEMFSVVVERIVDRWSGSIEAGVTAIHPNNLELPGTMTDLDHDTWMLSGFAVMKDGVTLRHGYPLDLDKVVQGSVIGMMRHDDDATLHYYLDGVDMGPACSDIPVDIYPCIDLYGQCAQVSIISDGTSIGGASPCCDSENLITGQSQQSETAVTLPPPTTSGSLTVPPLIRSGPSQATAASPPALHKVTVWKGGAGCILTKSDTISWEGSSSNCGTGLAVGWCRLADWVEVVLVERVSHLAGSLVIGVTGATTTTAVVTSSCGTSVTEPSANSIGVPPLPIQSLPRPTYYVAGSDLYGAGNELLKSGAFPSLDWLRPGNMVGVKLCSDSTIRLYVNSIDQGIIAHNIKKPVYFVVQVSGSTSSVKVVNRSGSDDDASGALIAVSSNRAKGEAPLASLDAESPPATVSDSHNPPIQHHQQQQTSLEEVEASCEKGIEDTEKSSEEGDKAVHEGESSSTAEVVTESVIVSHCRPTSPASQTTGRSASPVPSTSLIPAQSQPQGSLRLQGEESRQIFHECHGRNIQLSSNRLAAKRTASYNQGIVLSSVPLSRENPAFQVRIESCNSTWTSGLSIGVTSQSCVPACSLSLTALGLKSDAWVVSARAFYHNSHFVKALNVDLTSIGVGGIIGLTLDGDNILKLVVNGVETYLTSLPPFRTYLPLVDLYGTCDQVSLLVDGCCGPSWTDWSVGGGSASTSAAMVNSRRMTSSWADPTTSRSKSDKMNENISLTTIQQQHTIAANTQRWSSVGELRLSTSTSTTGSTTSSQTVIQQTQATLVKAPSIRCDALAIASRLVRWLVLPKGYFSLDGGECLCDACRSSCSVANGSATTNEWGGTGWTRHPLCQKAPPTWLTAFSSQIPLSWLRWLLDSSTLPPYKGGRWSGGGIETRKERGGREECIRPIPPSASRQQQGSEFKECWSGQAVYAAAEVAVRPGSYKVSDSNANDWTTKETNAIVITAILFHIER